jgi:hypothetical protein
MSTWLTLLPFREKKKVLHTLTKKKKNLKKRGRENGLPDDGAAAGSTTNTNYCIKLFLY